MYACQSGVTVNEEELTLSRGLLSVAIPVGYA